MTVPSVRDTHNAWIATLTDDDLRADDDIVDSHDSGRLQVTEAWASMRGPGTGGRFDTNFEHTTNDPETT
jgi:hypothetical protein